MESSNNKVVITEELVNGLKETLLDTKQPIAKRFRSLFTLRGLNGPLCIDAMCCALKDESALLRHEIAYCLGQMEDEYALKTLIELVGKQDEHPMVRHEAAEALGAIGSDIAHATLKQFSNDPVKEVSETCQLALSRVEYYKQHQGTTGDDGNSTSLYMSVDPAPSLPKGTSHDELKSQFLNSSLDIFNRYRALFSLRDIGDEKSVLALCDGLKDESSALLRHEVAFVLGQLQHRVAIEPLTTCVLDESENAMVRHEAAEALGAIASTETIPLLEKLLKDREPIVSESCAVALDVTEYFNNTESFQYADGIKILLEKNIV